MVRHLHPVPAPAACIPRDAASTPVRIIVAEGHGLMRRSLVLLLEHDCDLSLVASAPDLRTAVAHVFAQQADVLVLDLGIPDGSSLHTIGDLRKRAPRTQIVALTMNDDPAFARGALAAGALGFVLKQLADEELLDAVRAAARGSWYVSPRVAARLDAAHGRPVAGEQRRAASMRVV
jgi:two-component system, NarL family, response regulator NreC